MALTPGARLGPYAITAQIGVDETPAYGRPPTSDAPAVLARAPTIDSVGDGITD